MIAKVQCYSSMISPEICTSGQKLLMIQQKHEIFEISQITLKYHVLVLLSVPEIDDIFGVTSGKILFGGYRANAGTKKKFRERPPGAEQAYLEA